MREYAEAVVKRIKETCSDFDAKVIEVMKVNDENNIGVQMSRGGSGVASIHYVASFYEGGISAEDCAAEMVRVAGETETVAKSAELAEEFTGEKELTWDSVKDRIAMRLVNLEYNEKYLADKVHLDMNNGLAVMFDIIQGDGRGAITNHLADTLGCDVVMLVCAAQTNELPEPRLFEMTERIFTNDPTNYFKKEKAPKSSMFVLTANEDMFGAAIIYKQGVGDKVRELVGDYYLLPASLHEWIVVPVSSGAPLDGLCKTVAGANDTVVEHKDLLSYGVYQWTDNGLEKVA